MNEQETLPVHGARALTTRLCWLAALPAASLYNFLFTAAVRRRSSQLRTPIIGVGDARI